MGHSSEARTLIWHRRKPLPPGNAAVVHDQTSEAASHFGFVSLPHLLGSSLCIFSICLYTSGCFSVTCFTMTLTISSHDEADSFSSQFPPSSLHVIVFIERSPHTASLDFDGQSFAIVGWVANQFMRLQRMNAHSHGSANRSSLSTDSGGWPSIIMKRLREYV